MQFSIRTQTDVIDLQAEGFPALITDEKTKFLQVIAFKIWEVKPSAAENRIAQFKGDLNGFPVPAGIKVRYKGVVVFLVLTNAELIPLSISPDPQKDFFRAADRYAVRPITDG